MKYYILRINDGLYFGGRSYTNKKQCAKDELPVKQPVLKPFAQAMRCNDMIHAQKVKARLLKEFPSVENVTILEFEAFC